MTGENIHKTFAQKIHRYEIVKTEAGKTFPHRIFCTFSSRKIVSCPRSKITFAACQEGNFSIMKAVRKENKKTEWKTRKSINSRA